MVGLERCEDCRRTIEPEISRTTAYAAVRRSPGALEANAPPPKKRCFRCLTAALLGEPS